MDSVIRFRAADGFSHSRALAFQFTLTLLPALIAVVGLAVALGQDDFTRIVRDTIQDLTPGATGEILTDALRQGSKSAHESGETALVAGGLGRPPGRDVRDGPDRARGEPDLRRGARPAVRCGSTWSALGLALTAGLFALLSLVILMGGCRHSRRARLGRDASTRSGGWPAGRSDSRSRSHRWPCCSSTHPAAASPRRPGSPSAPRVSVILWLVFMGVLARLHGRDGLVRRHVRADRRNDRRAAVDLPLVRRALPRARLRGAARGRACGRARAAARASGRARAETSRL